MNCPNSEIIIETEEIAKNLKYFEFDDGEIIKFKFNNDPIKNKINFLKLISSKMEFYLNLLLNCRKIEEIDLNVYQINKINKERLNLFFEVFKSLSLKSLIISSSFENDIIFNIIQSGNIAKSCKKLKLHITDLEILNYIINNYSNLENLEINIEAKIAKLRINTPNRDNIKSLNDNL